MIKSSAVVACTAYKKGQRYRELSLDEISEVLQESDVFVWIGVVEPDTALLLKIKEEFSLHELAVEDASNAHQRPKLEEYGQTLFIVLHTLSADGQSIRIGETHIFVGPRFIVTVRHGSPVGYGKPRERAESMPDRLAQGPGFALYTVIDFVVDQYQPCMDMLQQCFSLLEADLFSKSKGDNNLEQFYRLKNQLVNLQAAAVPLIDVCTQLMRFHQEIVPKESQVYYRDILDHVSRVTQTADRMRQMIDAAMQVALAQVTIKQNEVVKKLAGWGAILAIPTMVFSWYGMNFEHMPELKWPWAYPAIMAAIAVGCVALYRRLRRAGWL